MATQTTRARRADHVIQFSVFTPNRLGRLHDLIGLFDSRGVHVLGLMVLDTTDSAIIRMTVDDPDLARDILKTEGFVFQAHFLLPQCTVIENVLVPTLAFPKGKS